MASTLFCCFEASLFPYSLLRIGLENPFCGQVPSQGFSGKGLKQEIPHLLEASSGSRTGSDPVAFDPRGLDTLDHSPYLLISFSATGRHIPGKKLCAMVAAS